MTQSMARNGTMTMIDWSIVLDAEEYSIQTSVKLYTYGNTMTAFELALQLLFESDKYAQSCTCVK